MTGFVSTHHKQVTSHPIALLVRQENQAFFTLSLPRSMPYHAQGHHAQGGQPVHQIEDRADCLDLLVLAAGHQVLSLLSHAGSAFAKQCKSTTFRRKPTEKLRTRSSLKPKWQCDSVCCLLKTMQSIKAS